VPAADRQGVADALARYYDLDLLDDPSDVEMYIALAAAGDGTVLELMAGSGRIATPLAVAGNSVVAVDRDAHMLARAAARWKRVKRRAAKGGALELVQRDVTKLKLEKRFGLVIVALNSLLLLDGRGAQRNLFDIIAAHLRPDGRAVIDVWLPAPEDLALYDGRIVLDWTRDDPETGATVTKRTSARYEPASRIAHVTSFFDEWRDGRLALSTMRSDTSTFVSADELERFASDAGLIVDTVAGDYEMGHFATDSERVVMVCRAPKR
jgi:SAM-dependent methyltransferase